MVAGGELQSGAVETPPCAFSLKPCCEVEGTGALGEGRNLASWRLHWSQD